MSTLYFLGIKMNHLIAILLLLLITTSFSEARITEGKVKFSISGETLSIKVDQGFHLNKDAPAKLILLPANKEILPVQKSIAEFIFSLGEVKKQNILLEYYVCDDQNTTCEQHKENYLLENNLLTLQSTVLNDQEKQASTTSKKIVTNEHQFITDNLDAAKDLAAREKKLLFVDFSAPWCPACLRLETEVFGEKFFLNKTKNLIKVTLNKDLDINKEHFTKYNVSVIPTMIIMNAEGIEIYRTVDFRDTKPLVADIMKAVKNHKLTKSYDEFLALANHGDKDSIRHLAMRAYEMYDTKEAINWFSKLNEESLFSAAAQITAKEKNNSKNVSDFYQKFILKYPTSFDSIVWRIELVKLLQPENQTERLPQVKTLLQENIILITKSLKNKKLQKKIFDETAQGLFTSFETEELYSKLIETYQLAKDNKAEQATISLLSNKISQHSLSAAKTGEVLVAIDYMKVANLNPDVEKWFIKLIEQNPTSDLYPRKLARFYLKEKKYNKALPVAQLAVKLSSRYLFWSYALLAQTEKALNLNIESKATALKALDLPEAKDPNNDEFVTQLKSIML